MTVEKMILTPQDFEEHPVWQWNASTDALIPVDRFEPLPELEPVLFMKARFRARSGEELDGYLGGLETFFVIGVFLSEEEFLINFGMPSTLDRAETRAHELFGTQFRLFPLEYQSDLAVEGKEPLAGRIPFPYDE